MFNNGMVSSSTNAVSNRLESATNRKIAAGATALTAASLLFYYQMTQYQAAKKRLNAINTKYNELYELVYKQPQKLMDKTESLSQEDKDLLYGKISPIAEDYDPALKEEPDKTKVYDNFLVALDRDSDYVKKLKKSLLFSSLLSSTLEATLPVEKLYTFFFNNRNKILGIAETAKKSGRGGSGGSRMSTIKGR